MPPAADPASRSQRLGVPLAFVGGAALYGAATSWIPSPHGVSAFWVANLCAPWIVLAFMAGRSRSSWRSAVALGTLAEVACVVGFYARDLTLDPLELAISPSSPSLTILVTSLQQWLEFVKSWLVAGLVAGAGYGALGFWWRRSGPLVAGLAVAAAFLAEPILWPLRNGYYQGPWTIWAVEVTVGLAGVAYVVATRRRADAARLERRGRAARRA